jgi:CRP-like cAMP-binding protein
MYDDLRLSLKNKLLNSLAVEELERIRPLLERVELGQGQILAEPQELIGHVYFPETAMISVVAYSEAGQGTEVSVVGSEGAGCLAVVMGADSTPYEARIQVPGQGHRISTAEIRREFDASKALRDTLLGFMQKLHIQVSQTVLCNRIHSVEQRLSRWLLMCHDRSESDLIQVTQEFLAIMLGSSRTSVTLTAIELQKNGFISYERGKITIRDRGGLEEFTCSCYEVIRDAYGAD